MIPREEWSLPCTRLGRRVLLFDSVDSTNTRAALLADNPANDGLVLMSEEQTAGRGQHGRSWEGQRGTAVLLSALVFPPSQLRRPVILAALAAVSVCETIREAVGQQAKIKWPNDVLLRGRKVCGILIEQARGTVIGIGLNVNQTQADFDRLQLPYAGSLSLLAGGSLDRDHVARLLIAQLDKQYDRLVQGDLTTLETAWKLQTGLLDRHVIVECHDGTRRGVLSGLGFDGLLLTDARGSSTHLQPEAVKHVTALSGTRPDTWTEI